MPITLTRALLVILIPGGIALSPWVFFLLETVNIEGVDNIYSTYSIPINAGFFAAIVFLGCIVEGLNSHLEKKWDDERESALDVLDNWYAYLSHVLPAEPVAFHYISRMVTTMYFELAMMWSGVIFGAGIAALICTFKPVCFQLWAMVSMAIAIACVYYFKWQAKNTHEVLCKTRKEMNTRIAAYQATNPSQ